MDIMTENGKKVPHAVDETHTGREHRRVLNANHDLCFVGYSDIVEVRNVEDTSDEVSPCKHEWIGYWQDRTWLRVPKKCANSSCSNKDSTPEIVGAHVRINGEPNNDRNAWIVPLCKSCNSAENKSKMKLSYGTCMVRVVMSMPHKTVE